MLQNNSLRHHVLIGTGFPVAGIPTRPMVPVGAIALYRAIETSRWRNADISVRRTTGRRTSSDGLSGYIRSPSVNPETSAREAQQRTGQVSACTWSSRLNAPGWRADGHYYNMRGENISARCAQLRLLSDTGHLPNHRDR